MDLGSSDAGVCGRTVEVCEAIVALIPQADHCGTVTANQLAELTGELNLNSSGVTSLKSGDFAGLTGLSSLLLSRNMLTTLPTDIFSGLVGLQNLSLSHNRLETLSADMFSRLTNLDNLRLNNNQLSTLPATMFSRLVKLKTLRLQANALTSVSKDMFSGLVNLEILDLEFNQLTTLPVGVFDGLDLWFLGLEGNRLHTLQAGLFDSLKLDLTLDLSHNELTTLEDGVFSNLSDVVFLDLAHNRLQDLPEGIFAGLTSMGQLFLEQNPGANFVFTMEVQRVANTNKVVVVVPEGAPFNMTTTISATGGVLEDGVTTVTVPVGHTMSDEITVTPLTGATVSLGAAPARPRSHLGYRVAIGSPFTATTGMAQFANSRSNSPPELSVDDAKAKEATGATMDFVVTMSRASSSTVKVNYETSDGTATAGEDYIHTSDTLTFLPGDTSKTVPVEILNDTIDDSGETFTFTLSKPRGGNVRLRDAVATGTIENSGLVPKAWLARFGRAVASQAVDTITSRMEYGGAPHLTVAGLPLWGEKMMSGQRKDFESTLTEFADPIDGPSTRTRSMTGQNLLLGSSFQLSSSDSRDNAFTIWGRLSVSTFDAQVERTHLDSTITSGFFGVDFENPHWLAGLAVSLSEGDGDYMLEKSGDRGDIENSLTTIWPYVRMNLTDKVDVWGLAGYGTGELKLTQHLDSDDVATYRPDIDMRMIALGAQGEVLSASKPGDLTLALRMNTLWVRTTSDAVHESEGNLAATEADVNRFQLLARGSWDLAMDSGVLMPSLELGIRLDGGDAETGAGIEIGTGLHYQGEGFSVDGMVRTLVAHEEEDYQEWSAAGEVRIEPSKSGRGLSLTLSPSWGVASSSVDRLESLTNVRSLVPESEFNPEMRLNAKISYGFGLTTLPGVMAPYVELAVADEEISAWRAGVKGNLLQGVELVLEATRNERAGLGRSSANSFVFHMQMNW